MNTTKQKWSRHEAAAVAQELITRLDPFCERLIVAGSLRRAKQYVGDIELLYVSRTARQQADLFSDIEVQTADEEIGRMIGEGILDQRESSVGRLTWGPFNKLAIHRPSGIPVDLFRTTVSRWANSLVCRSGPTESNIRIASAARTRGWQWKPYGEGFISIEAPLRSHSCETEKEVFAFVGLPFLPPCER